MTRLHSAAELEALRASILAARDPARPSIAVCAGAACHGLDSMRVAQAFQADLDKLGADAGVDVRVTGCHGYCEKGPNVVVGPQEICYFQVTPADVPEIVESARTGKVIERLVLSQSAPMIKRLPPPTDFLVRPTLPSQKNSPSMTGTRQ